MKLKVQKSLKYIHVFVQLLRSWIYESLSKRNHGLVLRRDGVLPYLVSKAHSICFLNR